MKQFELTLIVCLLLAGLGVGCASAAPTAGPVDAEPDSAAIFFDDFSYFSHDEMTLNGWILREGTGWPGVEGAHFKADNVSFIEAADLPGNRLLRMTSSTDGTAEGTFQTQICQQRKFLEGTFAARVRFRDEPEFGTDGDQVVETFYAITPYVRPMELAYSEMDFEYLPNGGWGSSSSVFYVTTWETVQIEPWNAVNASTPLEGSLAGWHTLVAQAAGGEVRYFVDSRLVAQHGDPYFPDSPMSINFNLWFINGGLIGAEGLREYREDVDWVFFAQNTALTQDEVEAAVSKLRADGISFQDDVPPASPPLGSPCDL